MREVGFDSRSVPCKIFGRQIFTGAGFYPGTSGFPSQYYSTTVPHLFPSTSCSYQKEKEAIAEKLTTNNTFQKKSGKNLIHKHFNFIIIKLFALRSSCIVLYTVVVYPSGFRIKHLREALNSACVLQVPTASFSRFILTTQVETNNLCSCTLHNFYSYSLALHTPRGQHVVCVSAVSSQTP